MYLLEFMKLYKPEMHIEKYQRDVMQRLEGMDFSKLESRILASQSHVDSETDTGRLHIGVDFGSNDDLTSVCIVRKIAYEGSKVMMMIVDDIYTKPMKVEYIDRFRFIESPLAKLREEPTADDFKASPGTSKTKKPLPYYQGKRRF